MPPLRLSGEYHCQRLIRMSLLVIRTAHARSTNPLRREVACRRISSHIAVKCELSRYEDVTLALCAQSPHPHADYEREERRSGVFSGVRLNIIPMVLQAALAKSTMTNDNFAMLYELPLAKPARF